MGVRLLSAACIHSSSSPAVTCFTFLAVFYGGILFEASLTLSENSKTIPILPVPPPGGGGGVQAVLMRHPPSYLPKLAKGGGGGLVWFGLASTRPVVSGASLTVHARPKAWECGS